MQTHWTFTYNTLSKARKRQCLQKSNFLKHTRLERPPGMYSFRCYSTEQTRMKEYHSMRFCGCSCREWSSVIDNDGTLKFRELDRKISRMVRNSRWGFVTSGLPRLTMSPSLWHVNVSLQGSAEEITSEKTENSRSRLQSESETFTFTKEWLMDKAQSQFLFIESGRDGQSTHIAHFCREECSQEQSSSK
jgi:hypothetical protein